MADQHSIRLIRNSQSTATITVNAPSRAEAEEFAFRQANAGRANWIEEAEDIAILPTSNLDTASGEDMVSFRENSDVVAAFVDGYCQGNDAAALVMRADGSMVISDLDRDVFSVMSLRDDLYVVERMHDPILLADLSSRGEVIGTYADAVTAFEAALWVFGITLEDLEPGNAKAAFSR